jgi:hypothetical protein
MTRPAMVYAMAAKTRLANASSGSSTKVAVTEYSSGAYAADAISRSRADARSARADRGRLHVHDR